MQEIVFAVVLFTSIVLALALLILLARSRLVPGGDIRINVSAAEETAHHLLPNAASRHTSH